MYQMTDFSFSHRFQWVESSDLESETQESNPAKYHDAWRAVVGAQYVWVPR